jgi:predicted DNA-binding protein (MmcQ/YjbR family)
MNIEDFYKYCISKPDVTEDFPFDKDTLVFKVKGKMFALTSLKKWEEGDHSVNLKCDPDYAKKHWNTVFFNQDVPDKLILELINHSYELVAKANKKK